MTFVTPSEFYLLCFPKHTSKYPCTQTSFFHGLPDSATNEYIKFRQKMLVVLFKSVCLLPGITFAFCKIWSLFNAIKFYNAVFFVASLFDLQITDHRGEMAIEKATSIKSKNPILPPQHTVYDLL